VVSPGKSPNRTKKRESCRDRGKRKRNFVHWARRGKSGSHRIKRYNSNKDKEPIGGGGVGERARGNVRKRKGAAHFPFRKEGKRCISLSARGRAALSLPKEKRPSRVFTRGKRRRGCVKGGVDLAFMQKQYSLSSGSLVGLSVEVEKRDYGR